MPSSESPPQPQPSRLPLRGVYAPVLTPFTGTLAPDARRFIAHCRWLVERGAGLAIFGTNSEAASLTVDERLELTEQLLAAGIPPERLMPGTGACALGDAVRLSRHAVASGAPGVLMLPPFYYKGVSDDGLFAWFAEVIERVGSERLGVYLYHIPQVSQVPIPRPVIERLLLRYPRTVRGLKDSSGDWPHAEALIRDLGPQGFAVFPASESLLSRALALGGAGCISATVNVNPAGIRALFDGWSGPEGQALQARADAIRRLFQAQAMIPAMKHALAEDADDPAWRTVRPPLQPLAPDAAATLMSALRAEGFAVGR